MSIMQIMLGGGAGSLAFSEAASGTASASFSAQAGDLVLVAVVGVVSAPTGATYTAITSSGTDFAVWYTIATGALTSVAVSGAESVSVTVYRPVVGVLSLGNTSPGSTSPTNTPSTTGFSTSPGSWVSVISWIKSAAKTATVSGSLTTRVTRNATASKSLYVWDSNAAVASPFPTTTVTWSGSASSSVVAVEIKVT